MSLPKKSRESDSLSAGDMVSVKPGMADPDHPGTPIMNIATYNLLKGGAKRCHWQRLLEVHGVDVLFVQESYPHEEHLPPLLYPRARDRSVWANVRSNRWGSGIFSSSGVLSRVVLPKYDGWVVGARIRQPDWRRHVDEIFAFSVHAPDGEGSYPGQVNRILDEISSVIGDREVMIAGDFNFAISDSGDGRVEKRVQDIRGRLADEFGLMNCWTEANPGDPLPQTLRWMKDRSIPFHCDGIFVPREWKSQLKSCEVLSGDEWDDLSDHNPVVARFGVAGGFGVAGERISVS